MAGRWTDEFYGDLYYESVADLLTARLSSFEARVLRALLALGPAQRVLDLGCGHGRHARALSPEVALLAGVDRSRAYLERARDAGAALVRGDLAALPFARGAFDAAYAWYSTLFVFDDAGNEAALAEAARVLKPGGRLAVHHANPLRLAREPLAHAERLLPDGGRVEEWSTFDAATGRERSERRMVRADGTALAATAELRYYLPQEWERLAPRAGLRLLRVTSTWQALGPEGFDEDAPDLIALTEKIPP